MQDILPVLPVQDDYYLLKWLRARCFNLQKSEAMLWKFLATRSLDYVLPRKDDMQRVIDQQLMDKHPKEWSQPTYSFSTGHGAKRRARPSSVLRPEPQGSEPMGAEGNRLFSFFKKN